MRQSSLLLRCVLQSKKYFLRTNKTTQKMKENSYAKGRSHIQQQQHKRVKIGVHIHWRPGPTYFMGDKGNRVVSTKSSVDS